MRMDEAPISRGDEIQPLLEEGTYEPRRYMNLNYSKISVEKFCKNHFLPELCRLKPLPYLAVSSSLNGYHIPMADCDGPREMAMATSSPPARLWGATVLASSPGHFWVFVHRPFRKYSNCMTVMRLISGCDEKYLAVAQKMMSHHVIRGMPHMTSKDGRFIDPQESIPWEYSVLGGSGDFSASNPTVYDLAKAGGITEPMPLDGQERGIVPRFCSLLLEHFNSDIVQWMIEMIAFYREDGAPPPAACVRVKSAAALADRWDDL